jgi:hypothetical protein
LECGGIGLGRCGCCGGAGHGSLERAQK